MKKAKIMLLTIAVVAIVGIALAFKVKKIGTTTYCYAVTNTQPTDANCNIIVRNKTAPALTLGTKIYYTTTTSACNCGLLACTSVAELPFGN